MEFNSFYVFDKDIERLKKKYPHLEEDIKKFQENFSKEFYLNSDAIPGFERQLWKARIASTDMKRGKSGGFRLIFYYNQTKGADKVQLLNIYPKSERGDLSPDELMELFKNFMKSVYEGG